MFYLYFKSLAEKRTNLLMNLIEYYAFHINLLHVTKPNLLACNKTI